MQFGSFLQPLIKFGSRLLVLVLLDLSAVFGTIDHDVLLQRLSDKLLLEISVSALAWFESYIQGRTQSVTIGDSSSSSQALRYGVPQGSVLEPQLFSIYAAPLSRIISRHELDKHFYADESQLYRV